jgi:putative toxin-antitoxin system antitoxin component (TIGR02293 family)
LLNAKCLYDEGKWQGNDVMVSKPHASRKGPGIGLQIEAMLPLFTYENIQKGIKAREIVPHGTGALSKDDTTRSKFIVPIVMVTADIVSRAIPPRTFARRIKENQTLDPREADAIARLLRVAAFANKVLGDDESASIWLTQPNPSLRNHVPLDMAETDVGAREVETTLRRIAYGDYS